MNKTLAVVGVLLGVTVFASNALAEDFQDHVTKCVDKFASPKLTASVVLECTAGSGKLSDCKVVSNSLEGHGFDKAAVCLADFLPMGSRTGSVRVPIKFQGN